MSKRPPPIPASLLKMMAELGPKWGTNILAHTKQQSEAFSALLADAPKEGVMARDIAYGPHPRQILDVIAPIGARAAPVVMFAHGGAFVEGSKDRTSEIYSNVCWYFARHGIVGINLEYRLAPEVKYPGVIADVRAAVSWCRANAERYGGDPGRIFLMGHSAGGAHVGCYAYDKSHHPPEGSGVSGLIVVSSRLRIDNLPSNPNARNVEAYFGTDTALMEQGSVVNHAGADCVPTMIAIAEFENPLLDIYGLELAHRLALAKGRAPRTLWLTGHNHNSSIAHMNTADDRLGREILEFMEAVRNQSTTGR